MMDQILYQIFKITLSISTENKKMADNHPIRKYVNKIANRIIFETKTRHYLKFFTPETIKLFGSTKIRQLMMKVVNMLLI